MGMRIKTTGIKLTTRAALDGINYRIEVTSGIDSLVSQIATLLNKAWQL